MSLFLKKELSCSKCKKIKSIFEFYKSKTIKRGFSYWCQDCHRNSHKKVFKYKVGVKHKEWQCSKCQKIKSTSQFYPDKSCKKGFLSHCISCDNKASKERYNNSKKNKLSA